MAMRRRGDVRAAPSQTEKPADLNNVALQLTMKWIDHSSEASELAVSETRLAEAQAEAIGRFFNVVRTAIAANFAPPKKRRKAGTPAVEAAPGPTGDMRETMGANPAAVLQAP